MALLGQSSSLAKPRLCFRGSGPARQISPMNLAWWFWSHWRRAHQASLPALELSSHAGVPTCAPALHTFTFAHTPTGTPQAGPSCPDWG